MGVLPVQQSGTTQRHKSSLRQPGTITGGKGKPNYLKGSLWELGLLHKRPNIRKPAVESWDGYSPSESQLQAEETTGGIVCDYLEYQIIAS